MKKPIFSRKETPKNRDLVLIGVVKRKKDLEHLRKDRWYRIPSHLSFRKSPRYLAVYPTSRCGSGGGGISFYSTIREITRIRRIELLPEEKSHPRAGEWYWKLHLGPIRRLPHRIENRLRRRVTFAYTTRSRLFQAREIGELFGIPPLEEILRRAIVDNRINPKDQFCVLHKKRCRYRIDFAIFCRKGKIAVECDHSRWHQKPARQKKDRERDRWLKRRGWTVMHFTEGDIMNKRIAVIELIKDQIQTLGGQ
jgi:very-short-patch-repair endonuclease